MIHKQIRNPKFEAPNKMYLFLQLPMIVGLLLTPLAAQAQTKAASASPTVAAKQKASTEEAEIKDLRDKLANKVAEMNKNNKKAVAGVITNVKDHDLTIKSSDDTTYDVTTDDTITKYYQVAGTGKKEIKLKDLTKDTYIIVSGPTLDKTVQANVIYVDEQFIIKSGKIVEINKDDNIIKVASTEKDNYDLDYTTKTKFQMLNIKTLDVESTTLAKIKEGDTIHFVGKNTDPTKDSTRLAAQKIFIIPQEYFSK
jgi:hypothetical protein